VFSPAHDTPADRRRLATRTLAGVAAVALVVGLVVGALTPSGSERTARSFAEAWERGDYGRMYELLTPAARDRVSAPTFRSHYEAARATATAVSLDAGRVREDGDGGRVELAVRTRIFGVVRGSVNLPIEDEHVDWAPHMVFPGLEPGKTLTRRTEVPRRARILSREGRTIVSGPADARVAEAGPAASIVGSVAPAPTPEERAAAYARGFPIDTPVGTNGLERALEPQLAGRPGGELLAGGRRLAVSRPVPAKSVRSTIDLDVQAASVTALAGRFGGIAALDPGSGKVRALAGIAFSAPQPPGSTFKIITATAALEEKIVKPSNSFPVETRAIIDGVPLENANGESCGGTFIETFAESCNSVFAPLGVKLGAKRLVAAAERFGFNEVPTLQGAATSTIPPATEIDSPLAVGSTAIGQGKVLATPLEMAVVADTIASGGVRHPPTLIERAPRAAGVRVTTRRVARIVEKMMVAVVAHGTGTAASLAPVPVAGKTGTAELRSTVGEPPPGEESARPESDTDAWFAAYAPVRRPRLAVGVLFVKAGAGGSTAAPAARIVLQAGLTRAGRR
jgi:peptidoglycan glycosyltransferase